MSYEPKPGSIAFRALAHMELLHPGSEISTGLLASQVGVQPSNLIAALEPALAAGAIFRRQKGGHARSPVFWSLFDHAHAQHRALEAAIIPRPAGHSPVSARSEAAPAAQPADAGRMATDATPNDGVGSEMDQPAASADAVDEVHEWFARQHLDAPVIGIDLATGPDSTAVVCPSPAPRYQVLLQCATLHQVERLTQFWRELQA